MTSKQSRFYIIMLSAIILMAGIWLIVSGIENSVAGKTKKPSVMLWAWERPENLLAINPQKTGVAFWAQTIFIDKDKFSIQHRLQPLAVPPNTYMECVVRLQPVDPQAQINLTEMQMHNLVGFIIQPALRPDIKSLQIDFDATFIQRQFYKKLLEQIRFTLPQHINLSITALASWCLGDNWLSNLPTKSIVPMLFTMGSERKEALDYIERKRSSLQLFKECAGISLTEPDVIQSLQQAIKGNPQTVYIFSPHAWQPNTIKTVEHTF